MHSAIKCRQYSHAVATVRDKNFRALYASAICSCLSDVWEALKLILPPARTHAYIVFIVPISCVSSLSHCWPPAAI